MTPTPVNSGRRMRTFAGTFFGIGALLLLPACRAERLASDEAIATFSLTSRAGIDTYAVVPDQLKLAAADVFRNLAADAPDAPPARLARDSADAIRAEKGVHGSLPPPVQREILPHLAALNTAAARGDRATARAASLEVSRLLYQDLSSTAEKQAAFALLDNRLLAIQADLRQSPIEWKRIGDAARLADRQRQILSDLPDVGPSPRLDDAFATLTRNIEERNSDGAQQVLNSVQSDFAGYRQKLDDALPDQALVSNRNAR